MSSDAAKRSRDEDTFTLDDLDDFAPAGCDAPVELHELERERITQSNSRREARPTGSSASSGARAE